jgi:hypothetical protein
MKNDEFLSFFVVEQKMKIVENSELRDIMIIITQSII